jgi:hypothetical protein
MSMSQEEIESLMNGLDFEDEKTSSESAVDESESQGNMSEDDINDLIAQTEDIVPPSDSITTEESVDDLLNSIEDNNSAEVSAEETNIDDILKELEEDEPEAAIEKAPEVNIPNELIQAEEIVLEQNIPVVEEYNIDELLSSVDNSEPAEVTSVSVSNTNNDDIGKDWTDDKIKNGIFPLPVEEDTKVVNQLNEVATDSEEKATKIFDVLSNILDYNNDIQTDLNELNGFNEKQIAMLNSLSQKFPNIDVFKQNLDQAENMGKHIDGIGDKLNDGNTEIFQAMELMQFHDINRQKIERVMSVIRKLSTYLNNLFEDDDSNRAEVAVANHIHGDNTDDLMDDEDLESLITEFNK